MIRRQFAGVKRHKSTASFFTGQSGLMNTSIASPLARIAHAPPPVAFTSSLFDAPTGANQTPNLTPECGYRLSGSWASQNPSALTPMTGRLIGGSAWCHPS
jgi:hypothetical protein